MHVSRTTVWQQGDTIGVYVDLESSCITWFRNGKQYLDCYTDDNLVAVAKGECFYIEGDEVAMDEDARVPWRARHVKTEHVVRTQLYATVSIGGDECELAISRVMHVPRKILYAI